MAETSFDLVAHTLSAAGPAAALERLVELLRAEDRCHELCDALLMQARLRLGLPIIMTTALDELREPVRTEMENACIAIYREVGMMLLRAGRVREGWMYLRPVGDRAAVALELMKIERTDQNVDALLELAIHEGIAPRWGFELLLRERGLCNSITMYDGVMSQRPLADRQEVAALLVRHIYDELVRNVRYDIARRTGQEPPESTVAELIRDREWLFGEMNYHVDASHLAAVVRFALNLTDAESLRLAVELTQYGMRLHEQYRYPGHPPFEDVYPSHRLFFRAQLGDDVVEALDYFRRQAEAVDAAEEGSEMVEVYVGLLARLKRYEEAFEASARLLPRGVRTSGFAPSLLELGHLAENQGRMAEVFRERDDVVGFTAGLLDAAVDRSTPA